MASNMQAQNLFVADSGSESIYEFTPSGAQSTFATDLYGPEGLAFDSAGDLFQAIVGGIYEFTNGIATEKGTFATVEDEYGLAFNSAGELFVTHNGGRLNGFLDEFTPGGTLINTVSYAATNLFGLAFDSAGDLFVGEIKESGAVGQILEITPGGVQSVFASGLGGLEINGLAFNSAGDLFVSDEGRGNIYEFTTNGTQSTFASGLNLPYGLAFDSAGDLFEADLGSGNIYEFTNGVATEKGTFASGLGEPTFLAFQPVPDLRATGANGMFRLTVSMPSPYYSTIVQASTNLVNWCNIYTNTPPFTFTDSTATTFPYRFYRAVLGP